VANPETIVGSMRERCTAVFEACQEHLPAAAEDKADFVAEEGMAFFDDWFNGVVGYDITFQDLADAVTAMETLLATFESVRAKLQVVRTR
jgi:hypothetical protein